MMMKIIVIAFFFSLVPGILLGQVEKKPNETIKPKNKMERVTFFGKTNTRINNPLELRDPFKRKISRITSGKKGTSRKVSDGYFSNVRTIDGVPLESIRIIGVLIGKQRRAIAKIQEGDSLSKESYILKEGMTIGENDAEIKAILPGGIVLVEKIRNVYDQDEYLETILPVTTRF